MKPRMPVARPARLAVGVLCAAVLAAGGVLAQSTQASTTARRGRERPRS
jgi:hypothetical protein